MKKETENARKISKSLEQWGFWNSLPVAAVDTKHKFYKWIVQWIWLTLTQENPRWFAAVVAVCPIAIAMKMECLLGTISSMSMRVTLKLQFVFSAAISLKYDSALWGLRRKRVGVLENKSKNMHRK